jgi:DNA-binding CsgD family transcriptional regulator
MATRSGAAAHVQQEPDLRSVWIESTRARERPRTARLSEKERAVLRELARGYSTEEVGKILSVSPHTVRTHIKNGLRKLGARTRAHAVAIALSEGVIDYDPRS